MIERVGNPVENDKGDGNALSVAAPAAQDIAPE
jgi:hypothetical protein